MQSWPLDIFKQPRPPPGYICGIGRGAIGFVTRNDIGPASVASELGGAAGAAGRGKASTGTAGRGDLKTAASSGDDAGTGGEGAERGGGEGGGGGFDKFSGYNERLFADSVYDADDAEADKIYDSVEQRMEERSKRKREQKEEEDTKTSSRGESRISDLFADLKAKLGTLSNTEWDSIPDIGDPSLRGKKRALDKITPVPDSLILSSVGIGGGKAGGVVGEGSGEPPDPASSTSLAAAPDILGISAARGQMLSMRLNTLSDSVAGQVSVDASGYLTALTAAGQEGGAARGTADIADVKRARLMFRSMVNTNPHLGTAWISAARLEEEMKDLSAARRLITEGCAACPGDEDVWAEAARLATPAAARAVLADAVARLPHSVTLWLLAAGLEGTLERRREVLRKALTVNPGSERLWKEAVALEGTEDAKIMLARAVECVPLSLDLWLALARMETYENAQRVLNQARASLPAEPAIWVAAARLEESAGGAESPLLRKIAARALKSLSARQVLVSREAWFKLAEEAERGGNPLTAHALVASVLDSGVEEADRLRTWEADARALESAGCVAGARAVIERLLEDFPGNESLWRSGAEFEKRCGKGGEAVESLLRRAVSFCPEAEVLWLMAAKEAWLVGKDVARARQILMEAFAANPGSETVWLAAVKLEWENGEVNLARNLLERARTAAPSPRVWLKSAVLERESGSLEREEALLEEGVGRFSSSPKLWLMKGQGEERRGQVAVARASYSAGVKHCPGSIPLWCAAARLEARLGGGAAIAKARTVLEAARHRNPAQPLLWLEAVRMERRAGADKVAEALLARALKECPGSGILLAEDIESADRHSQKRKSVDALSRADGDVHVVVAVARLFAGERKLEKARKWFSRAVALDPDYGDALAALYAFELDHGQDKAALEALEAHATTHEPCHGEHWQAVAKAPGAYRLSKVEILKATAAVMRKDYEARRNKVAS